MSKDETKKYFVGQQEIIRAEYPQEGWVRYTIQYPNMQGELEEVTETIPEAQFQAIKSETPYENGQVAVRQWNSVISELLGIFLKHDVRMGDVDFIIQQLQTSLSENYKKATAKLYKRRHKDFVRLTQVDEILKSDTEMIPD